MKILNRIKRQLYKLRMGWRLRKCTKPVRDFGINMGLIHYDNYLHIKKLKFVQADGVYLDNIALMYGIPRAEGMTDKELRKLILETVKAWIDINALNVKEINIHHVVRKNKNLAYIAGIKKPS